jgi:hypothetical protein
MNKTDPTEERSYVRTDTDGRDANALTVTSRDYSTKAGAQAPVFADDVNSRTIVEPVKRDIAKLQASLAEVVRFDPRTGQPVYAIQGDLRERLQKQLAHLEDFTLPLEIERGKQADAYHANKPSLRQNLQAQLDRREAVQERATEILQEQEAQQLAARIAKQRGGLGIG